MNCCFIGHRKIDYSTELEKKLEYLIENLVLNKDVDTFLFGSRSEFNDLCHKIVTKLKEKYPHIARVMYSCKSESCTLENKRIALEECFSKVLKQEINLMGFEKECEFKEKYTAGRASYLERNKTMIDESDYCVFYFNEDYKLEKKKVANQSFGFYEPKSGTKLAVSYARQKKKTIINVFG